MKQRTIKVFGNLIRHNVGMIEGSGIYEGNKLNMVKSGFFTWKFVPVFTDYEERKIYLFDGRFCSHTTENVYFNKINLFRERRMKILWYFPMRY